MRYSFTIATSPRGGERWGLAGETIEPLSTGIRIATPGEALIISEILRQNDVQSDTGIDPDERLGDDLQKLMAANSVKPLTDTEVSRLACISEKAHRESKGITDHNCYCDAIRALAPEMASVKVKVRDQISELEREVIEAALRFARGFSAHNHDEPECTQEWHIALEKSVLNLLAARVPKLTPEQESEKIAKIRLLSDPCTVWLDQYNAAREARKLAGQDEPTP